MRIGVDANTWSNSRGYGRFTRELIPEMVRAAPQDEFVLFADAGTLASLDYLAHNIRRVTVRQRRPAAAAASATGYRSPTDMLRMSAAVTRTDLDAFFCPSVYTYFPLPPRLPAVVAIHDAIAERFPDLTLPSWRARLFWNAKSRLARLQARLILTVSGYASRQITELLGVPSERIRICSEAPARAYQPAVSPAHIEAVARRVGLPAGSRWFTYVGGFNPHKYVDLLIAAHGCLVRDEPQTAPFLVLVGAPERDVFHSALDGLRRAVADAGTGHRVLWPGYLSDDDLASLHSGALALALPSASEGFGLPAVEAAACGTAVIATTESPLPELLDGGGIFVPPGDVGTLADAMRWMQQDEGARRRMGTLARRRAARLSWAASARVALAAVREVAR